MTSRYIARKIPLILSLGFGTALFVACENDLRDVEKLANIQQEENVNISKDVTVTYSDSAVVKAELTAPELREYPDSVGLYEFKKGTVIRFFDENGAESQRVKSDYATQRPKEGLTEFRGNVVITMANGSIIKTEELFFDEKKNIYYNTVPIVFDLKDGRGSFQATSFVSDTDFKKIDGQNMTGYYIPSNSQQFPMMGR
ncbi:LPS export ABC transporter periplasmic protein LptC [Sphingobacterium griseoflavum]|uniref:LPS export ABC transporter periplasmic protein LptC n=1 Tax=Sphingobacterium griseoflavum TaxID=1474952 RepID=UPI00167985B7|nr:LPS export ABC transporter periplasmic protein LptC [Sphingobacterium griseoflavum]